MVRLSVSQARPTGARSGTGEGFIPSIGPLRLKSERASGTDFDTAFVTVGTGTLGPGTVETVTVGDWHSGDCHSGGLAPAHRSSDLVSGGADSD